MKNILKLHLGCGEKHIKGFVNVDSRDLPTVDVVADAHCLSMFEPNSVDLIYCSHILEHFGRREYKEVLEHWISLLKTDGILRLAVPDFEAITQYYARTQDLSQVMGLLYGGQTYPENFHYCTWDFATLQKDLEDLGLTNVQRYNWRETEHAHIDDFSQAYLPHMDKESGYLMSLNIEATKR